MALTDNLVAYWKLDEASGSRADSVGSATLTDNNAVSSAAGNLSALSASFLNTSSQFLSTTNADVIAVIKGSASWTINMWINPTNVSGNGTSPCGTFDNVFSGLLPGRRCPEAGVDGLNVDNVFWQFWNDGTTRFTAEVTGTNGRTIAGQWSMISCQFDSSTSKLRSRTNATASADVTVSGTFSPNAYLKIGQRGDGGGTFWKGQIGHVGLWSRALSVAELDSLYNSGAGLAYPFTTSTPLPMLTAAARTMGVAS